MSEQDDTAAATASESSRGDDIDHEKLAGLVHAFISMMHAGNIQRLDLEHRGLRISLRAHGEGTSPATIVQRIATPSSGVVNSVAHVAADSTDQHTVTAPMIGTFYTSPAPNEPEFVKPGDRIDEGQTIGIIEAMKIMNEIAADRAGTIVDIVARNGQPVEFGSPLLTIVPDVP